MDKEILRIVIIASGLLVMMAMLLWGYLRSRRSSDNMNLFDGERNIGTLKESLKLHPEHDDFDVVPLSPSTPIAKSNPSNTGSTVNKPQSHAKPQQQATEKKPVQLKVVQAPVPIIEQDDDFDLDFDFELVNFDPNTRVSLPAIIQFSIIANADRGFNGIDLFEAFESAGLQYGSLKIFERVNSARQVDFGVACMIEPGTFPDINLETFYCPGIVFFMQHGQLEDALSVFDDYVDTIAYLAQTLDGVAWDHQRQPLSEETVEVMRRSL